MKIALIIAVLLILLITIPYIMIPLYFTIFVVRVGLFFHRYKKSEFTSFSNYLDHLNKEAK